MCLVLKQKSTAFILNVWITTIMYKLLTYVCTVHHKLRYIYVYWHIPTFTGIRFIFIAGGHTTYTTRRFVLHARRVWKYFTTQSTRFCTFFRVISILLRSESTFIRSPKFEFKAEKSSLSKTAKSSVPRSTVSRLGHFDSFVWKE